MGECAHCATPLTEIGTRYCSQCWGDKDMLREIVAVLEDQIAERERQLDKENKRLDWLLNHLDSDLREQLEKLHHQR